MSDPGEDGPLRDEPPTILVVDDDEAGRYVTCRILQRAGYRTLEAASGQQALDLAAQRPHAVLLDVKLPDFSGFEVCRRLRADPATAHIPVLHLSATFQDEGSVIAGLEGGADGYLTQPVKPPVLLAYVRALLRMGQTLHDLQRSEAQFRSLFESMTDGLLLADPRDRCFRMANQTICDMLGYTRDELAQMWLHDLHPPEHFERSMTQLDEVVEHRVALVPNVPTQCKDGSIIHVDIGNTQLTIDGRTMVLGSFRDVSERRALESRLAQSDRLASVGLLASGVAHELNNPLAHTLLELEAVGDELERAREAGQAIQGPQIDALHAKVQASQDSALRIRGIVSNLQRFSRVEQHAVEPVQLTDMVQAAAAMATHEVRFRVRLELDLQPVPPIQGNQGRLTQVFLNLLIRAAAAIEEGQPERNRIAVRTYARDGTCRVEIEDTGRHIEADSLDRLFDPFATTTQPGGGSSLGLAICHRIVHEHGGHILVESGPDQGSRFTVVLPGAATPETPQPPEPEPEPKTEPARPRRLLVVDDEHHLRRAVQRLLVRAGFEVATAASGLEARELLEQDRAFDVILCDLMMPGLNGMELHSWLVAEHPHLAQRVLFLTGGTFTPHAEQYLASVDNRVLAKPLPRGELIAAINALANAAGER